MRHESTEATRLAVFVPNWIGDAVMATPALRALRQRFAQAEIVGIMKPYVAGVLDGAPWFDRILFLDKKGPWNHRWPAVALALRRQRFHLAILLTNTLRSALTAWLAGCLHRVGYALHGRRLLLTDPLPPLRDHRGRLLPSPVLDAYNRLALHVGCPDPGRRMYLFTSPQDEQAADRVWQAAQFARRRVVCLNPGAAFGSAKCWPAESFARLARSLRLELDCGVLVLCGPNETAVAQRIAALADCDSVHTLAEHAPSIGLTKACIRRCDLLVTTDSGPRHFGCAFDRPVLTLFGPTHIAWTETFHPLAVHVQKQVECGPCQRRVCPLDHRCMKGIEPDEVFTLARRLLWPENRLSA